MEPEPTLKNCWAQRMRAVSRWRWRSVLSRQGFKVNNIDTTATVHLEKGMPGIAITHIDLVTKGDVEGIDEAKFKEAAEAAKSAALSRRALAAVPMTIDSLAGLTH